MPKTEAQMRAIKKYNEKVYEKFYIRLRKDSGLTHEVIQRVADEAGESLNTYVVEAIRRRIKQDMLKNAPED